MSQPTICNPKATISGKIMFDVQNSAASQKLTINKVGIKDLCYPVYIETASGRHYVSATINMSVNLCAHKKGVHMSRFIELLNSYQNIINYDTLQQLAKETADYLAADNSYIHMRGKMFYVKEAPITHAKSFLDCNVAYDVSHVKNCTKVALTVSIPVTTLCPCSKTISKYGAHNQRSLVNINITSNTDVFPEELIKLAEQNASCDLYALLKRSDEKYVTERAYDNPKFVEDLVRDIAHELNNDQRILSYEVSVENIESIHNHSAYAVITNDKAANNTA